MSLSTCRLFIPVVEPSRVYPLGTFTAALPLKQAAYFCRWGLQMVLVYPLDKINIYI